MTPAIAKYGFLIHQVDTNGKAVCGHEPRGRGAGWWKAGPKQLERNPKCKGCHPPAPPPGEEGCVICGRKECRGHRP